MTIKEEITNNLIGIQFLTEQDGLLKFIDSGDEIDGHFIIFDSTVLQQHFILNSLQVFNDKAFKLFLFLNLVIFRLRFHALCGIINIIVERWFSICI